MQKIQGVERTVRARMLVKQAKSQWAREGWLAKGDNNVKRLFVDKA